MADKDRIRVLDRNSRTARLTLLTRLDSAPFPVTDAVTDFYTGTDSETGERLREIAGNTYGENDHYRDDRVFIHVPPGFDPTHPCRALLHFHGHRTETLDAACCEQKMAVQLNRSGANAVLIAPQLAHDAADSHSGKLSLDGGARKLLEEATGALAEHGIMLPGDTPVVLTAFSGGYRAVSDCLLAGDIGERVEGVILLDALYARIDEYARWRNDHPQAFFIALNGDSTRANANDLTDRFRKAGFTVSETLPDSIAKGDTIMLAVETPHTKIPVDGPPLWPVASLLKRLPHLAHLVLS